MATSYTAAYTTWNDVTPQATDFIDQSLWKTQTTYAPIGVEYIDDVDSGGIASDVYDEESL